MTKEQSKKIDGPKVYDLAEVIAEAREEHPPITIRVADQVFSVDAPQLWSDEAINPNVGPEETARAVLGDQFDAFRAAGGTVSGFSLVLAAWAKDNGVNWGNA
jgi:hypothetical protein